MNIDTEALLNTKSNLDTQINKFNAAKNEIDRLLNTELKKAWEDEASVKLNEKYNTVGKESLEEVGKILTQFATELERTVEEFNDTVTSIGNNI